VDWADRIAGLRRSLKLSQSELGRQLNSSAMAVSRWERGVQEPPATIYIQLGNLTGDPACWYFWGRAGLHSNDVMRVLPAVRRRLRQERPAVQLVASGSRRLAQQKDGLVAIPLLPLQAAGNIGAPGPEPDMVSMRPEGVLAGPRSWSPSPDHSAAFPVSGNSMAPLIHDGYIVIVDTSQSDPGNLVGHIVAAWHSERGVIVSRLQCFGGTHVLIPENRAYEAVPLSAVTWRILGKVLWWIGRAA